MMVPRYSLEAKAGDPFRSPGDWCGIGPRRTLSRVDDRLASARRIAGHPTLTLGADRQMMAARQQGGRWFCAVTLLLRHPVAR
jgi:hypothetical protein